MAWQRDSRIPQAAQVWTACLTYPPGDWPVTDQALTRRAFLRAATEGARNSLIVLSAPALLAAAKHAQAAMAAGEPLSTLGADEAAEFEAIAARIIPTDETPGAREAGVIYFMDNVLGGTRAEMLPVLREQLGELQLAASGRDSSPRFHSLSEEQQDALLRDIEDTPFFNTLRYLTIAGMFSAPAHGGNRDRIGWQLIGFENRHVWQAPYGFYDADYMEKGE